MSAHELQPLAHAIRFLSIDAIERAAEGALRFGWDRWLCGQGAFVGMRGFGASGPADALYRHFGITDTAVAAEARRLLQQQQRLEGAHLVET